MFVVVVYDITDNKRRTRLFKALKNFGTAIQYSAFECIIEEKDFAELQDVIRKVIHCDDDRVRVYTICKNCHGSIKNMGKGEITMKRDVIIV